MWGKSIPSTDRCADLDCKLDQVQAQNSLREYIPMIVCSYVWPGRKNGSYGTVFLGIVDVHFSIYYDITLGSTVSQKYQGLLHYKPCFQQGYGTPPYSLLRCDLLLATLKLIITTPKERQTSLINFIQGFIYMYVHTAHPQRSTLNHSHHGPRECPSW
jgi:hypothetical protein